VHDPTDPVGRLLFNVLAMVAEFESDLIKMKIREGMKVARAKGRLRGKLPKLTARQDQHLVALHQAGEHTSAELAELFGVARSTMYRAILASRGQSRTRVRDRGDGTCLTGTGRIRTSTSPRRATRRHARDALS
jgi:DNA invertase Pin-like site-specific DNA recombinase